MSARALAWKGTAACAAVFLAACAATPPRAAPESFPPDAPFVIEGRLSVRHGAEALTANFNWQHAPPRDVLVVSTPLGQTVAEISGDAAAQRYELRRSDGPPESAATWSALTARALGAPIPVEGLSSWIVGAPRPNAPRSIEADALGRPLVLRQDGWEIVYAYADEDARLPDRLRLTQPDLEVRIAVLQRQ